MSEPMRGVCLTSGEATSYITVTAAVAAAEGAISGRGLRAAIQRGDVAAQMAGRTWLVSLASLNAYLSDRPIRASCTPPGSWR